MKFLFLSLLLLVVSCGDEFKKVESLGAFRILGVVVDHPEVAPGGTAALQLIVSDIDGANGVGRVITGTTEACIDPGIGYGASVSCDHDPATVIGTYTINTTTADMVNNLFTGLAADVLNVTIPATIHLGRSDSEKFNGVAYIVIFKFTVDGQEVKTFKRIVAVAGRPLNNSPVLGQMTVNGSVISSFPTNGSSLLVSADAPESYSYITTDNVTEVRSEKYQVAWFSSSGEFSLAKTYVNEVTKFKGSSPAGDSVLLAIVRDERGGLGFLRYSP
jgi:hypothetical protein